jgi:Probable sensor domain DACNV
MASFEHPIGGPRELAEALMGKRKALGEHKLAAWIIADLDDDALLEILRVAFELSFQKDEGRYSRLTMVVPSKHETHLLVSAAVWFEPAIPVTVRNLRRLSSAVPPRPHALLVKAAPEGLRAIGIGRFETAGAMLPEDQTGLYLRAGGLVLEVSGPGDISVNEAGDVFALRAGRIERQLDGSKSLGELSDLHALSDSTVVEALESGVTDRLKGKMVDTVREGLMYLLKSTVQMAHGGAFAVLPTDSGDLAGLPDGWGPLLKVTYPTSRPSMLASIAQYVHARWGTSSTARHIALQTLTDTVDAVARLSGTDGFVILNQKLRVLGFGAKVVWDERIPATCVEVDEMLHPTGGEFSLERAGTRHTAGYMLCQNIPGAHVFVVSQDGELRLFFTDPDEAEVRVTAPLAANTYLFQGI